MKRILKHARLVIVVNAIIASVLSILDFTPDLKVWAIEIGHNIVFTFCIGTAIYAFCTLTVIENISNRILRLLALLFSFLIGGWIGTAAGIGINYLLFDFVITPTSYIKTFFLQIGAFNVAMATVVYSYFVLKEKLHDTAQKLAEKEINEQRLHRLKSKAELEALQAKINPHFLFNTLNSIASLIPGDPEKAEEMLQKLADLLRYTLDASNHNFVKLSQEIEFIERYLEIEKIRLGERLNFDIHLDPQLSEMLLPGLLIQPLVENSIKHGIAPQKAGGSIRVDCRKNNGFCHIKITDNGTGETPDTDGSGFGMASIEERLNLHYNDKYEFTFSHDGGGQTLVKIPIGNLSEIKGSDDLQNNPD